MFVFACVQLKQKESGAGEEISEVEEREREIMIMGEVVT